MFDCDRILMTKKGRYGVSFVLVKQFTNFSVYDTIVSVKNQTEKCMEVQSHGLLFESEVISLVTGHTKYDYNRLIPNSYTSSMDIVAGVCSDKNYSIKVSKDGKSVGCGDILRFSSHCAQTEFTMVIGKWNQNGIKKIYDAIYEFEFSPKNNELVWGGLTSESLIPFVQYVKSIPRVSSEEIRHRKIWKQKRQELYDIYGKGIANIDAKINKQNRRVQCSVKINEMISAGIPHTKYTNNYKGIQLPYAQISPQRNRQ